HTLSNEDMDSKIFMFLLSLCSSGWTLKDFRLVGGSSRCAGTLQMKFKGEWKLVYKNSWTLKFAGEVYSVRLVNGINHCSGRLEVKLHELWSLVCEDGFNQQDAEVLCREIGCGPALVVDRRRYGEMYTLILKKEIPCGVNESSLLNCGRPWLRKSTCPSNSKSIWLTCSEVRFVGGANRCTGNLEIKQFGRWRAAGDRDEIRDWPLMQTNVICQRLDCGMSVFMGIFDHSSRNTFARSNTDVGQEGLALSLRSISSQRCSIGLRSGLCAVLSSSSTPDSAIHVFMDLALCSGAQSCWKRMGTAPNYSHKNGSMELSKISWSAEAFRGPFTGTKGPSLAPEKQPHTIIPLLAVLVDKISNLGIVQVEKCLMKYEDVFFGK
uniref:SRCR domain-containing protein n=1 Tax=Fundulus heteroclitus TaxID=8078 RepID=A0A3Q2R0I1_FUNHE